MSVEKVGKQRGSITEPALVERMRTEATMWINAVHTQRRRVVRPLVDPDDPGQAFWQQQVDLHLLLVVLTRLRRAVALAATVPWLRDDLSTFLETFDQETPSLTDLRNVAEHFDDYTTGAGRLRHVRRQQLQVSSMGGRDSDGLVWRWLDVEFSVDNALGAATTLYRAFLKCANDYLAQVGSRDEPPDGATARPGTADGYPPADE